MANFEVEIPEYITLTVVVKFYTVTCFSDLGDVVSTNVVPARDKHDAIAWLRPHWSGKIVAAIAYEVSQNVEIEVATL